MIGYQVRNLAEQLRVFLYTIVLSGAVIAAIILAAFVVPVIIGIAIVLSAYVLIKVLNEDSNS